MEKSLGYWGPQAVAMHDRVSVSHQTACLHTYIVTQYELGDSLRDARGLSRHAYSSDPGDDTVKYNYSRRSIKTPRLAVILW